MRLIAEVGSELFRTMNLKLPDFKRRLGAAAFWSSEVQADRRRQIEAGPGIACACLPAQMMQTRPCLFSLHPSICHSFVTRPVFALCWRALVLLAAVRLPDESFIYNQRSLLISVNCVSTHLETSISFLVSWPLGSRFNETRVLSDFSNHVFTI